MVIFFRCSKHVRNLLCESYWRFYVPKIIRIIWFLTVIQKNIKYMYFLNCHVFINFARMLVKQCWYFVNRAPVYHHHHHHYYCYIVADNFVRVRVLRGRVDPVVLPQDSPGPARARHRQWDAAAGRQLDRLEAGAPADRASRVILLHGGRLQLVVRLRDPRPAHRQVQHHRLIFTIVSGGP